MSADMFAKSEVWRCHGGTRDTGQFCVEVKHWMSPSRVEWEPGMPDGPHRWNVYAVVFPGHPAFDALAAVPKDGYMSSAAVSNLPLHWGATFFEKRHDSTGAVTSVNVGSDYMHLHDEIFMSYATPDEARSVFMDAEDLFEFLQGSQQ